MTDPDAELIGGFWRLPLPVTIQYAKTTRSFVDLIIERWARGQFVPPRCTPQWVAQLALQADLAEHVAARRLATLPDLAIPPRHTHDVKSSVN